MNPLTPHKDKVIGEWFSQKWHTPAIDGRIESHVGQRSGEVFAGRCYQGETGAYIDVSSFVTGTLTVKCWWKKENGTVHTESLDYNAIDAIVKSVNPIEATNPQIELTIEVDDVNKHIALTDGDLYYGLHVYSNGELVAIYLGEEGYGATITGCVNGNEAIFINATNQHTTDDDVPYNHANEFGYSAGRVIDLDASYTIDESVIYSIAYESDVIRVNLMNPNGNVVTFYHYQELNDYAFPGILTQAGFVGSSYYVTQVMGSSTYVILLRIVDGEYNALNVKFNIEVISMTGIGRLQVSNKYYVNAFNDIMSLNGWSSPAAIFQSQTDPFLEFYIAVSGSDPTYGDTYVDDVLGETGLTGTILRQYFTDIGIHDVNAWLTAIDNNLTTNPSNSTTSWSYGLRPEYRIEFSHTGTSFIIDFEQDFSNVVATVGYGAADYWVGNINEPFKYITDITVSGGSNPYETIDFIIHEFYINDINVLNADFQNNKVDAKGSVITNYGQVCYPLQLVESWCLLADGVWELQIDYEPTEITVNETDVFTDCTITDNGNGTWNILFPNLLTVCNLLINGTYHYPLSEGIGAVINGYDGQASIEATIINGVFSPTSIWQTQDDYHWNAYEGIYENKLTVNEADALVVEIDTSIVEAGYTDEYSYTIDPGSTTSAYYVIVDWGDGSSDVIKGGPKVHKYATSGVKTIKVYPYGVSSTVIRSVFSEYDQKKVLKVKQWGNTRLSWHQFRDCENLTIEAIDIPEINSDAVAVFQNCSALTTVPNIDQWDWSVVTNIENIFSGSGYNGLGMENIDLSNVTNMKYAFRNSPFNIDVSGWEVSSVELLTGAFWGCSNFEGTGINNWNTSGLTDLAFAFADCEVFTGDVSGWNVSNVAAFDRCFSGCTVFNSNVSSWDVSSCIDGFNRVFQSSGFNNGEAHGSYTTPLTWDVVNATDLSALLEAASEYGQELSLTNTQNVTNMYRMLYDTKFDKDLTSLSFESVEDMEGALLTTNAYSTANYNALLVELAAQAVQSGVTLDVNASYTTGGAAETARTDLINNYSWVINDNGGV